MRAIPTRLTTALAGLVTSLALAGAADAQLPTASARALGLGGNYTAAARGFGAVGANPAGLGMPDGPGFTLSVLPVLGQSGLDPVSLADLADFEDEVVPAPVKEEWLQQVTAEGSESGTAGAEITLLALTVGGVGFQVSTEAFGRLALNPDAVELVLFGNSGRTGSPADLALAGSSAEGFAVTTAGLSFGFPLELRHGRTLALGATVKYSVGNGVALARDNGTAVTSDPLELDVRFPVLHTSDDDYEFDNGNGFGLDVGAIWENDGLALAVAVKNLFHTFEWDVDKTVFRPGTALFNEDETDSDFDERPGSQAPPALLDALDEMTFDPALAVGLAYDANPRTTLTVDVKSRFGDGIGTQPDFHAGVGVEFRPVDILPLRAGGAIITDGFQGGGGATLILGPVHLSGALAFRAGDLDDSTLGSFVVSFGGS